MKEDKKSLEEKAKDFLKSRIEIDPDNNGFNPVEFSDFSEYAPAINYLILNNCLEEKEFVKGEEKTVKSIRYIRTVKGNGWTSK